MLPPRSMPAPPPRFETGFHTPWGPMPMAPPIWWDFPINYGDLSTANDEDEQVEEPPEKNTKCSSWTQKTLISLSEEQTHDMN